MVELKPKVCQTGLVSENWIPRLKSRSIIFGPKKSKSILIMCGGGVNDIGVAGFQIWNSQMLEQVFVALYGIKVRIEIDNYNL